MFDADKFDLELGAPQIRLRGRIYTGLILSFEEFSPFEQRSMQLDTSEQKKTDPAAWEREFRTFARDYLYAIFPRPPWWAVWRRDPVPLMLRHRGLLQALKSFFHCQARALEVMSGTSPTTAGPDSVPRTAEA